MAGTSIKLQLDSFDKIMLKRKLDGSGQKKMASEVKRLCEPYVPVQSHILENTAKVLPDGVLYDQPYAAKQYYSNAGRGSEGTQKGGLRGKQWDKRMMADHGKSLVQKLATDIGGLAK